MRLLTRELRAVAAGSGSPLIAESVLDLHEALEIPQSKASRHLARLRHAGIRVVSSCADRLALEDGFHKALDIHVHFPEGAVPKDGPSAGITADVSPERWVASTKVPLESCRKSRSPDEPTARMSSR